MLTDAFIQAVPILEKIESHGYEAYFVGGCVRDLLLKRDITDIDIASSASPTMIQEMFDKVIPVGIDHGTVIVRHHGISYEVTSFREEETHSDDRHPDKVMFIRNIEEDIKRRDFTMNALAMNKHGEIIDLFAGQDDLKNQLIRSVGNAENRFQEDPLRMIRALRFSSQLGFTIETNTFLQMKRLKEKIETVAIERLTNEFTKFFQGDYIQKGFDYFKEMEVAQHLPIFINNPHFVNKMPLPLSPFYSFAEVIALYHYLDERVTIAEWIKAWKCSNDEKREAINLYDALCYYEINKIDSWLVYRLDKKYYRSFLHLIGLLFHDFESNLIELDEEYDHLTIKKRSDLLINGNEIVQMFPHYEKGSWLSQLIAEIEKEVVFNRLENTKIAIKEWIRCHPPEIN